jgi:SAM-dependent methyltransferase
VGAVPSEDGGLVMTSTADMHSAERKKWDALATKKLDTLMPLPEGADFEQYARSSAVMPGVADFLGDLTGLKVLEYGCGLGELSVLLAKSGAVVSAFDISDMSVAVARRRAEINDVADQIDFMVSAAEDLLYADATFDVAFGKAILHHINPADGAGHLARVVKPGGRAAFVEPMGMNPLLRFVRDHVPYPDKNPPGGDKPVNYDEIRAWGAGFGELRYQEIQLLSMLERGLGFGKKLPQLRRADATLLERFPVLRRYCRYVVMFMRK